MPNERSVSRGLSTVPACAGPHADTDDTAHTGRTASSWDRQRTAVTWCTSSLWVYHAKDSTHRRTSRYVAYFRKNPHNMAQKHSYAT
jgi:hypothetical protein